MKYYIRPKNYTEYKAIISILLNEGLLWHSMEGLSPQPITETYSKEYPYIIFDLKHKKIIGQINPDGGALRTIDELIHIIHNPNQVVISNFAETKYDAIITQYFVKVGCQTISKKTVQQLYDLMKDQKEKCSNWDGSSAIYINNCDGISYETWLRMLQSLGYTYVTGCAVKSISEAIDTTHWMTYSRIKINPVLKTISGTSNYDSQYYEYSAWDKRGWETILNIRNYTPHPSLRVGEYNACVFFEWVDIAGYRISKDNIELLLRYFDELSN